MRLIDADVLLEEMCAGCLPIFEKGISDVTGDEDSIKDYVDRAPTVDAVRIVRCKDCAKRDRAFMCPAMYFGFLPHDDWFCADGVRDGGEKNAAD